MLRIKKKYLGTVLHRGVSKYALTSELTELELKFIQINFPHVVENYTPKVKADVDSTKKPKQ